MHEERDNNTIKLFLMSICTLTCHVHERFLPIYVINNFYLGKKKTTKTNINLIERSSKYFNLKKEKSFTSFAL